MGCRIDLVRVLKCADCGWVRIGKDARVSPPAPASTPRGAQVAEYEAPTPADDRRINDAEIVGREQ